MNTEQQSKVLSTHSSPTLDPSSLSPLVHHLTQHLLHESPPSSPPLYALLHSIRSLPPLLQRHFCENHLAALIKTLRTRKAKFFGICNLVEIFISVQFVMDFDEDITKRMLRRIDAGYYAAEFPEFADWVYPRVSNGRLLAVVLERYFSSGAALRDSAENGAPEPEPHGAAGAVEERKERGRRFVIQKIGECARISSIIELFIYFMKKMRNSDLSLSGQHLVEVTQEVVVGIVKHLPDVLLGDITEKEFTNLTNLLEFFESLGVDNIVDTLGSLKGRVVEQVRLYHKSLFNELETINSGLYVESTLILGPEHQKVDFFWPYGVADSVLLCGSWDDWQQRIHLTKNKEGIWATQRSLPDGEYEYKYIVDGNWFFDMEKPHKKNEAGIINNVLKVGLFHPPQDNPTPRVEPLYLGEGVVEVEMKPDFNYIIKKVCESPDMGNPNKQSTSSRIIDGLDQAVKLVTELSSEGFIGVSCRVISPHSTEISLVQLSTLSKVYVFDVLVEKKILNALSQIFANSNIKKVFHDCRVDVNTLEANGIKVENINDTQVAYSYLMVLSNSSRKELAYQYTHAKISLPSILEEFSLPQININEQFDWRQRPLNPLMTRSLQNTNYLVHLYKKIMERVFNVVTTEASTNLKDLTKFHCKSSLEDITLPQNTPLFLRFSKSNGAFIPSYSAIPSSYPMKQPIEEVKDIDNFLKLLPSSLHQQITGYLEKNQNTKLIEVLIDIKKSALIKFSDIEVNTGLEISIEEAIAKLKQILKSGPNEDVFSISNQCGIPESFHYVSCIRNRKSQVIGLTYHYEEHKGGCSNIIQDLVTGNNSILFIGPKGVGKTSILRDLCIQLTTNQNQKHIVLVDTYDKIGGVGDLHSSLGNTRRISVPDINSQYKNIQEATEHSADIIFIDEISKKDLSTIQAITNRGIAVIGALPGVSIENILLDEEILSLLNYSGKTPHHSKFHYIIQIPKKSHYIIYKSLSQLTAARSNGKPYQIEERWQSPNGTIAKFSLINSQ